MAGFKSFPGDIVGGAKTIQIRHLLLILLIMAIFGSAYPVGKLTLNTSLPPNLFAAIRMGLVFLFLIPFWRFKGVDRQSVIPLMGFALSMGVGVFMFMNLALVASETVSPIIIGTQLSIPFGLIISSFWLKEKSAPKKWIWVGGAFAGVFVIAFDPDMFSDYWGLLFVVIMSFFYGLSNVISRHIKHIPVTTTNAVMGLTGAVVLLAVSAGFEGNPIFHIKNIKGETWLLILHSALIISLIAHQSMFYLYKFYSVNNVLPFYSLFPVFGLIQTFLIFGESPTVIFFIGAAMILVSVYQLSRK